MTTATEAKPRPTALSVNLDGIPAELKERNQWVLWKHVQRDGEWAKVPYQTNGYKAKPNDSATWAPFNLVAKLYATGRWDGIGYMFAHDDPYVGIDVDACRDAATGTLTEWAQKIVDACGTYTDVSPSSYGVKLVARGKLPISNSGKAAKLQGVATYGTKSPEVALYQHTRYWALTGQAAGEIRDSQEAIDALWKHYFTIKAKPKATKPHESNGHAKPPVAKNGDLSLCLKCLGELPDAISGQGGHAATFRAACEVWKFGLADDQARQALEWYNATKCKPRWSDVDLVHKLDDARERVTADGEFGSRTKDVVTNGVEYVVADEDGNEKKVVVALSMDEIITRTGKQTDNWPRRVDNSLFVHDDKHGIAWLDKPQALFGWLHRRVGKVTWHGGKSVVGREELFAEYRRTARSYTAVENLPHEPPMAEHYYACDTIPPGDGAKVRELLERFNPATPIDQDLIQAAFLTPLWGGPPGTRPCFVITSDDGRGAGKSTLAELIGDLFGGVLTFSRLEDIGTIKTRLLSPSALTQRVALLDNIKSHRFSWSDLEGLITATSIGGRKLYVGEGTRPNTLVWFLTLNGAALSCDMAQRSVIIKINKPTRSATWLEDTRQFIDQHRRQIIGDLVGILRGPTYSLRQFTRWATWERDILQRLPEPADAQRVIMDRQAVADIDHEEAGVVQDFFADQLGRLKYVANQAQVFIPSQIAARWLNWSTNDRHSVIAASRILTQMATEGRLRNLSVSAGRTHGRGFVWSGEYATETTKLATDLVERIRKIEDAKDG